MPAEATKPPPDGKVGAVLVLIADGDDGPSIVLTRRRRDMRSHPGQLSFPGGRVDPGETIVAAALREAQEEIALDATSVEVVGQAPVFFVPPSRFWVAPVVARWTAPHELDPNPWEVDAILHVPVAMLLEEARWRHVPLADRGSSWAWQLDDDDLLWGATAIVVSLLLEVAIGGWSRGKRPEDLTDELAVRPWETAPRVATAARLPDVPEIAQQSLPHLTGEQTRALASLLASHAGLELSQLVEAAGRAVARAVRGLLGDADGGAVTVLAGPGGAGAAGLAAARLLAVVGARVSVQLLGSPRIPSQLDALRAADVDVRPFEDAAEPGALIVDAMLGAGGRGPLEGAFVDALRWTQRFEVPVVAVDLPTGMDVDIGLVGPAPAADVTVALGAPKKAHAAVGLTPFIGDLYLADLGVPAGIWRELGFDPPVLPGDPLVRLVPT